MNLKKYYNLAKNKLFPICRSITGKGVRKTLKIIKSEFPHLKIKSIRSGTKVFDWNVPAEWNIYNAYIIDKMGKKIVDFKNNNLHLIGYSQPINKILTTQELLKKLYSLKKQPNAIPYVTSYYKKNWGFCVTHNQKSFIKKKYNINDKFRVVINSSFKMNGKLNFGELLIKGKSKKEILISTYICHPSMANNELSGSIVSMSLINYFLKTKKTNNTLRFVFIPETIGSIAYLSKNLDYLKQNVIGGYNLTCIGDDRKHSCLLTKYKDAPSDLALTKAYKTLKIKYKEYSFLQRGSDERQYNSPGIDLKITSIFRSKYWEYPEYHTSLDNFNLVTINGVKGGFEVSKRAILNLDKQILPKSNILGEPQMGKRNLYPSMSMKDQKNKYFDYLNFIQYSDGFNSIEKICKLINISKKKGYSIYNKLKIHKIIK